MGPVEIIFGILLLVMSVFLVIAVLMQSGKDKRLSGSIAGGAETFFGKGKGSTMDKLLSKLTVVFAVLAFLVTLALVIVINTLKI